jgi:ubiquinone/menaquinone biosynthesis C-methylase UbiE
MLIAKNLPFKDKEFDFVISSHDLEHVEDFSYFINEL